MLSENDIEEGLSYAYLHAIATRAGFGCKVASRAQDNASIDAQIDEDGRLLAPDSVRTSFGLHVQLKATRIPPVERDGHYSFGLPLHQYNRLRDTRRANPRILVVLYLPPDRNEWLQHSEDGTIFRRCAYWVSLRGAKASDNDRSQTVYVPRKQLLSPETLTDLMTRCSRDEEIDYAA